MRDRISIQVLHEGESSRVVRVKREDGAGTMILKESLGPYSMARWRHELGILERLAGLDNVPQLRVCPEYPNAIAMEDLGDVVLASVIPSEGMEPHALLELSIALTRIVAALHRRGVVHKDINPANIVLVGPERRPYLIDFDLATTFAEERPAFVHYREIAGTLNYLAPEQTGRTGRLVDWRVDLYSLGATLYELAVGRPPFEGDDPLQLIRDHLVRVPVPPVERAPEVPRDLSEIILRLLEKEPDRRYQSAEGLESDLIRLRDRQARGEEGPFPLGERDFPMRLTAPSRLIGRESEIERLCTLLEGVVDNQAQTVLIAGGPGVGKTALIDELRPIVTARRGLFGAGKFDQYRRDSTTGGVCQAISSLARLLLAEPETELVELRERLREALGMNLGLVTALVPELATLLGESPETPTSDPTDTESRVHASLLEVLRTVATPLRPVVLVVDDLQWARPISLRFFDRAMRDEELRNVLLIGTYRDCEVDSTHLLSSFLSQWERLDRAPCHFSLHNLPPSGLGMLLEEMLRLRRSEVARLVEVIGERTAGNPYDTVELINSLRQDGALVLSDDGWRWDEATIRRFVGRGEVVDLLSARIDRLPSEAREFLEVMACLGGKVKIDLLRAATGLSEAEVEQRLVPPLEDGLLVKEIRGRTTVFDDGGPVWFRHDRVQQAVYGRQAPARRRSRHLELARRLVNQPGRSIDAAEQYLPAVLEVHDPAERRRVAILFREAAASARLVSNQFTAEHYLEAALRLVAPLETAEDQALCAALEIERHESLYVIGCFNEADRIYAQIERRGLAPLEIVGTVCLQITSLGNRGREAEALALGFELFKQLGQRIPRDNIEADIAAGADAFYRWVEEHDWSQNDIPPLRDYDPRHFAVARLISHMMPAAFLCDRKVLAWLAFESGRLWIEHGPCAPLVGPVAHLGIVVMLLRDDYLTGYRTVRYVLSVSEALGFYPQASQARFLLVVHSMHWFEPLENDLETACRAREELMQGGDLQFVCFTYAPVIWTMLDCDATLDRVAAELDTAIAFSEQIGHEHSMASFVSSRWLVRSLMDSPNGCEEQSCDESLRLAGAHHNPISLCNASICMALSAALLNDAPGLAHHAAAAMAMLGNISGAYPVAQAHLLQALALANRVRAAEPDQQPALLVELDACRDWLARRAADAPGNFLHMLRLVEAERAWALNDFQAAATAFDRAQHEVSMRSRPWHRGLIFERAALFYLAHGLEHMGHNFLVGARAVYKAWGATAKVRQLDQSYPSLRAEEKPRPRTHSRLSSGVSSSTLDMLAILRASQTLSSETSMDRLRIRVGELLEAITGATKVSIVLRNDETQGWCLPPALGKAEPHVPLDVAGARGRIPLSAFRYAERTGKPLLVDDATRDDRFSRDPYFADLERCSLLVVPILNQGVPRAMLLLENRLSRAAFSTDGMDAVMLIAGQLAVSLDNALLYQSLERMVVERTEELGAANRRLESLSLTDPLTGLSNRRRFDDVLAVEWQRAQRSDVSLGAVMIDVDEFKRYNDHYGHPAGDACLRRVAATLAGLIRQGIDLVARYGGEEFALILPGANLAVTREVADRVCASIAALEIPHLASERGIVTVSVGMAAIVPSGQLTPESLVAAADAALYKAKSLGRNQVAEH